MKDILTTVYSFNDAFCYFLFDEESFNEFKQELKQVLKTPYDFDIVYNFIKNTGVFKELNETERDLLDLGQDGGEVWYILK